MPTYEFACPHGHAFEKFYRKISDAASELPCPVCGQVAVRKVSGGAGLVFKGSGFYITDYGKDGKKGAKPADKAPEVAPGEAKTDAVKSGTPTASDRKPVEGKPATSSKKSGSSE